MTTDSSAFSESSRRLKQDVDAFITEIRSTIEKSLVCEFQIAQSYVNTSEKKAGTSGDKVKIGHNLAITAKVDGADTYRLEATYVLVWNQRRLFLAVHQSSFSLYLEGSGEPLFHYDYLREPRGNIPGVDSNF